MQLDWTVVHLEDLELQEGSEGNNTPQEVDEGRIRQSGQAIQLQMKR